MPLPSRGIPPLNPIRPSMPTVGGSSQRGSMHSLNPQKGMESGTDRASSFLDRMHQRRANKIASGSPDGAPTRGQERRVQLTKLRAVGNVVKSAAHEGVVERPMDQNLSKILERKRQDLRTRGTSVARVNRHTESDEVLESNLTEEEIAAEALRASGARESVRPEDWSKEDMRSVNERGELIQQGTSIGRFRSAKKEMGLKDSIRPTELGDMEI